MGIYSHLPSTSGMWLSTSDYNEYVKSQYEEDRYVKPTFKSLINKVLADVREQREARLNEAKVKACGARGHYFDTYKYCGHKSLTVGRVCSKCKYIHPFLNNISFDKDWPPCVYTLNRRQTKPIYVVFYKILMKVRSDRKHRLEVARSKATRQVKRRKADLKCNKRGGHNWEMKTSIHGLVRACNRCKIKEYALVHHHPNCKKCPMQYDYVDIKISKTPRNLDRLFFCCIEHGFIEWCDTHTSADKTLPIYTWT